MLAYLDDILEPQDAEELGKKIDESEFATGLMHRVRDCVTRPRLGVPAVAAKGLTGDPNTVAEYLDNTLEPAQVPEFEKICLESDVHLAEAAACHQILTLVLGEPAEVDPANRERVYRLIQRTDLGQVAAAATEPARPDRTPRPSDTPAPVTPARRNKPEVPDYLRESARARRWPAFIAWMLVAAVVTMMILFVAGPPELRRMVAQWTGGGENAEQLAANEQQANDLAMPESLPAEGTVDDAAALPPADETVPGEGLTDEPARDATAGDTTEPASEPIVEQPAPEPAPLRLPGEAITDEPVVDDAMPAEEPPLPSTDAAFDSGSGVTDTPPVPGDITVEPAADMPVEDAPVADVAAGEVPTGDLPIGPANPLRDPTTKPLDIAVAAGAEMGRLLTDTQVAVVFDDENNTWRRLPAKAVIAAGDRVLTLPGFRPSITLSNGVSLQAAAPSLLVFEGMDQNSVPVVSIQFGQLTMLTVGKAGAQVRLRFGENESLITFVSAQSNLALEVLPRLAPGDNPEARPANLAVDLYATSGEIDILQAGEQLVVKAPSHAVLTELSAADLPDGELPVWATKSTISPLEEKAAVAIEKELTADRPLQLTLNELAISRRAEVRALAIRCSGYLDNFDTYITALNDIDQRAAWPAQIESLKAAIARNPQTAAAVRKSFEQQRDNHAAKLYRMLWGYTAEQLAAGDAERLVDSLADDHLDVRVLSFWNLQNMTGLSLFYRPEFNEAKRRPAITKWREKLQEGKIVPKAG
jgi:hypothetical protein